MAKTDATKAGVDLTRAVEALLITATRPIPAGQIAEAIGESMGPVEPVVVEAAVEELNAAYEGSGRSFRIERVAGGYRVMTVPEVAPVIGAYQRSRSGSRLSKAAIETLAIIAYRQPVTRAEIEAIRGVGCGEMLKTLLERRLISIKGRAEELGRPMLYGTTRQFLDAFGLSSLKDLPPTGDLGAAT